LACVGLVLGAYGSWVAVLAGVAQIVDVWRGKEPRPAHGGERSGQPGQCLRRAGRGAAGDRVLRAGVGHQPRDRRAEGNHLRNLGNLAHAGALWVEALRIYEAIEDRRAPEVRAWLVAL
jgi:hypothetical protein